MIKVSVEVRSGAARFRVGVQARSIQEALRLAGAMYPGRDAVRVKFPIDPEGFFGDGPALAGVVETEPPKQMAA